MEYGDPDYHRVVLKLVALSQLGYLIDKNLNNNADNKYIFPPTLLRYVLIKAAFIFITFCMST